MLKLINHDRAVELMEREGLDGLIAHQPINSYYLSSYWGMFNTPAGYDGSYFAVLPRDRTAPAVLVVPALEIRRLETERHKGLGTWMEKAFAYTSAGGENEQLLPDGALRGADYPGWPVTEAGELTALEKDWCAITDKLGAAMSPSSFHALTRAVNAAGLAGARLGSDDARVGSWLDAGGLGNANVRLTPELFNEIRLVKTEAEIEILRRAAHINEMALLVAADSMLEGSTWDEVENMYMMTMAQQGGRGVYLMCGLGELPAGRVRRGEPVFLDALGQYRHYHGDFGRCAVVGEPTTEQRKRHAHLLVGWEKAQELLQPGVRYSEISSQVGDAVRKAGLKNFRDPVVHSLGLEHTDDPKTYGAQPQTKPDRILEPNMVLNIDLPHTEIGWGSVHMEDTVRITTYGYERLGVADMSIRIADG